MVSQVIEYTRTLFVSVPIPRGVSAFVGLAQIINMVAPKVQTALSSTLLSVPPPSQASHTLISLYLHTPEGHQEKTRRSTQPIGELPPTNRRAPPTAVFRPNISRYPPLPPDPAPPAPPPLYKLEKFVSVVTYFVVSRSY